MTEVQNHRDEIAKKAGISGEEFDILMNLIFENISILLPSSYKKEMEEISGEIKDPGDIPYLAACIAVNAGGIWTHDPDFLGQKRAKVFTNMDLLNIIREKNKV